LKIRLDILRQKSTNEKPYLQSIECECSENDTVAFVLNEINSHSDICDIKGEPVEHIFWDHSCLQKKCGACAMVINGRPRLACGARIREFSKSGVIRLEPLKKFPIVADLLTDRSVIFEQLMQMKLWADSELSLPEHTDDTAYEASRCLQCGCCLEVCPNFYAGGNFFGMSAAVPASRLIEQLSEQERKVMTESYKKHFYAGCGKSLACRDICPAGIDIDKLMVNSNSAMIFKRLWCKKHG
jgi:succinate dehydrogenase / fumarate reductase iron-sulfur subunit